MSAGGAVVELGGGGRDGAPGPAVRGRDDPAAGGRGSGGEKARAGRLGGGERRDIPWRRDLNGTPSPPLPNSLPARPGPAWRRGSSPAVGHPVGSDPSGSFAGSPLRLRRLGPEGGRSSPFGYACALLGARARGVGGRGTGDGMRTGSPTWRRGPHGGRAAAAGERRGCADDGRGLSGRAGPARDRGPPPAPRPFLARNRRRFRRIFLTRVFLSVVFFRAQVTFVLERQIPGRAPTRHTARVIRQPAA